MPGNFYYECDNCAEHNPDGCCYPRDMLRVMPKGGEWICENCYDDAPDWQYVAQPADEDAEQPRWSEHPLVPAATIAA